MSVYVRLGIRLLYKGLKSNSMEAKRSTYLFGRSFNNVREAVKVASRLSTSAAHVVWQSWFSPWLLLSFPTLYPCCAGLPSRTVPVVRSEALAWYCL